MENEWALPAQESRQIPHTADVSKASGMGIEVEKHEINARFFDFRLQRPAPEEANDLDIETIAVEVLGEVGGPLLRTGEVQLIQEKYDLRAHHLI